MIHRETPSPGNAHILDVAFLRVSVDLSATLDQRFVTQTELVMIFVSSLTEAYIKLYSWAPRILSAP